MVEILGGQDMLSDADITGARILIVTKLDTQIRIFASKQFVSELGSIALAQLLDNIKTTIRRIGAQQGK